MTKKKTMWTVIAVVVLVLGVGLGIMFSGESSDIRTIKVEQINNTAIDSIASDTIVVDSVR